MDCQQAKLTGLSSVSFIVETGDEIAAIPVFKGMHGLLNSHFQENKLVP